MVKQTAKFSFMEQHILTPVVIECIANVLGDTSEGLTGSEIHKCLIQSGIEDVDPTNTKRYRLYNAFAKACNESKCSNCVFTFISVALAPERFVSKLFLLQSYPPAYSLCCIIITDSITIFI